MTIQLMKEGYSLSPGFAHSIVIRKKLIQRIDESCIKHGSSFPSPYHQTLLRYNT